MLQPTGPAAGAIAQVSWTLIAGGLAIFVLVLVLLARALGGGPRAVRATPWLIGGGVLFPAAVLVALFVYSVSLAPPWRPVPPPGALVVTVTGRMWWWDVRYQDEHGRTAFATANEIRIPVGRPVYLALASSDVIHSFWVPALAGKMDMVPGRLQHLLVQADRAGRYRGQCAEYCGEQHALMALDVVAEPPEAFAAWHRHQASPAAAPATPRQAQGRDLFLAHRCDACHAVRGVGAQPAGHAPDLTHLGGRLHIGAGTLANDSRSLARWVRHVQQVKRGARMPSYGSLDDQQLGALADWLGSLR